MDRLLQKAAEVFGIERSFVDNDGRERVTSPETQRGLLRAMGVPTTSAADLKEALREVAVEDQVPSVLVSAAAEDATIVVGSDAYRTWCLELEDGDQLEGHVHRERASKSQVLLPAPLPMGYHRLHLRTAAGEERRTLLVAAPPRCISPSDLTADRVFGLGTQIYGLRGGRDLGCGDLADLGELAGRAAAEGADFLALSPLHALFFADPSSASPYAPSHRAFLNWLLIAPDLVADGEAPPRAPDRELVDYPATAALRRQRLEAAFERFAARDLGASPTARGIAYREFVTRGGDALQRHCLFEALHEQQLAQGSERWAWWSWPEALRRPDSPEVAAFAEAHAARVAFFAWLQWLADDQLRQVRDRAHEAGMRIGLYRDLAVGVNPAGSLTWGEQDVAVRRASIGAPPDAFSRKGQNWGIAPFAPRALLRRQLGPWLADIRANMRHAGALRIDHAMGLRRLFWVPEGGGPRDGAYVRYPLATMLSVLALESHRARCLVIAEDLGTVPRGFRPALRHVGVLSSQVLYFEREAAGDFAPARRFRPAAVASISTHDLPTVRGFLGERDITWRERLKLFTEPGDVDAARAERRLDRERILDLLRHAGLLTAREVDEAAISLALHRWLARTPAALVMIQLEDLAFAAEQPNLPGTVDEHPNWRRRMETDLETLFDQPFASALLTALREARPRRARPASTKLAEPERPMAVLHQGRE